MNTPARPQKPRVRINQFRRQESVAQESLRSAVKVRQDAIEKAQPLLQPRFDLCPFFRSDEQRDAIQTPGAFNAGGVAIHVERDTMLTNDATAVFPARLQFVPSEVFEGFDELAPMWPHCFLRLRQFIKNARTDRVVVPQTR